MTRHIRLPLGSTTTETHCGDCQHNPGFCWVFGALKIDDNAEDLRDEDCRAAEVKDEPPEPRHKCRTCGVEPVLLPGWVCSGCALY